ncbi:MAG: hypothetical protein AB7F89_19650 [Pirellulaceae bacterium]
MLTELISLGVPAVSIGFVHCVCGPDHYVPFVAMSRVGLWSLRKTLWITVLCGVGHVFGSAVIAFIGIALGLIVSQLEGFESVRGDIAAWMLLAFGVLYTVWGLYHAMTLPGHASAAGGTQDARSSSTDSRTGLSGSHPEARDLAKTTGNLTPWVLFTIFLFGPCEPLIPMLMVPAAEANMFGVVWITFLFGVTTLLTMTTLVTLIYLGVFSLEFRRFQQWGHALAGSVVMACGASILFLGL